MSKVADVGHLSEDEMFQETIMFGILSLEGPSIDMCSQIGSIGIDSIGVDSTGETLASGENLPKSLGSPWLQVKMQPLRLDRHERQARSK